MNANIQTAIEVLKQRIRSKEEDVVQLKRTVNEMCADVGQEAPYVVSQPSTGQVIDIDGERECVLCYGSGYANSSA